jgi:sulfatase maturation enzyme AslB (radical SAM superfamily)
MKFEKCPECKKKGFHETADDPIFICVGGGANFRCRYCGYQEKTNDYLKRTKSKERV